MYLEWRHVLKTITLQIYLNYYHFKAGILFHLLEVFIFICVAYKHFIQQVLEFTDHPS